MQYRVFQTNLMRIDGRRQGELLMRSCEGKSQQAMPSCANSSQLEIMRPFAATKFCCRVKDLHKKFPSLRSQQTSCVNISRSCYDQH